MRKQGESMRRKDRECNDAGFLDEVLRKAEFLSLAMYGGEFPYCIPLNFAHAGNSIYFHCAKDGAKLQFIGANAHVAFNAAIDLGIDRKNATTYFKSVCGTGMAVIVADVEEKCRALEALAIKYNARCPVPCPAENAARVAIVRVDIQQWSGKKNEKG